MELTTVQIQQVEKYLTIKKFDFIDLRIEVLDHIISDIEHLMLKNISFENAFKMVVLKWEKHFTDTSSFYFGMLYSESKIVVKNAIKMFKPFYFIYLVAYILPVVILELFPVFVTKNTAAFVNKFFFSFASVAFTYLIYIFVKTKLSKVKTTYRFILKTQYFGSVFLILGTFLGSIFNNDLQMNKVFTGFTCAGFSVVFICHHFFKKHQEAIKKYKFF